jgi:hypothetical protein
MDTNENLLNNDLQIDPASQAHLKETAGWAKFISIVGIVASILLAIAAFFIGAIMSRYSAYGRYGSEMSTMGAGVITVVYLIGAVITFFVSLYLNRFAMKMKTALDTSDQAALTSSFQNIKVYFRFIGIILIIYIAFIIFGLLATVLVRG